MKSASRFLAEVPVSIREEILAKLNPEEKARFLHR